MGKFDTWSITCKLCEWRWDTCSTIIAKHPKCPQCGGTDCDVKKNDFITIKKKGKIIADVPIDPDKDVSGDINGDILIQTVQTEKPLLVIRENDCRFTDDLTNEEKKELLGKIDLIKSKILRDIKNEEEN